MTSSNEDSPVTVQRVAVVNLGDIRSPLEVHFRFPLNRWKSPPATSKERTTTIIGGAPVGTVPSLSPAFTRCAMEMVYCLPGHRAMPLTAMPGGNVGWEEGLGPRRGSGVCCSITGHNCIRNNHTTDRRTTRTHKPAVITGTKPSVKMVLTV